MPTKSVRRKPTPKAKPRVRKSREVDHLILSPYIDVGPVKLDLVDLGNFFREFKAKRAAERAMGVRK